MAKEEIMTSMKICLPDLCESIQLSIVEKLMKFGCCSVNDLALVEFNDLADMLPPICIRKLLNYWKRDSINKNDISLEEVENPKRQLISNSNPNPQYCQESTDKSSTSTISAAENPKRQLISNSNLNPQYCQELTDQSSTSTISAVNCDPNWPSKFSLPCKNFSPVLVKSLEKGERILGKLKKELIHKIIENVHCICKNPRKRNLEVIAKAIYNKYPNAVVDKVNDMIVGLGYENFLKQLTNRSGNENRTRPNPLKRRLIEQDHEKLNMKSDQYGCINWQPPVENEGDLLIIKDQVSKKPCEELSIEEIINFIEKTFPLQRLNINANKTIADTIVAWPILFTIPGLLHHFNLLTSVDIMKSLEESLKKKSERMLSFFRRGINSEKIRKKCSSIVEEIGQSKHIMNSEQPVVYGVICLLMKYFDEDAEVLFHIVDEHTKSSDIDVSKLPVNPFLICFGENLFLTKRSSLVVDRVIVLDNIFSILQAVAILFASYFCFNIKYPENASTTLEFIQRCFVGINPDSGSKATKRGKKNNMNQKLLSLCAELADFEWINS